MKTQIKLILGLLIVFVAASAASAQTAEKKAEDVVTGKWTLSLDVGGQPTDITLNLTQKGSDFTGTMSSEHGDGTFDKGKIDAGKLTGSINATVQGTPMVLKFDGKIEAGKMTGTLDVPNLGTFSFAGSKAK